MSLTLEELNQVREVCDRMLLGLLGSEALVEKWWMSYNKSFEKTPNEQWEQDPKSVFNYVGFFCFGK